jgi:hypothetical protein
MVFNSNQIANYQQVVLYVGPSPATGQTFLDGTGFNGRYQSGQNNRNLTEYIDHVQNVSFSPSEITRANVLHLGSRGTIAQPIIQFPTIDLSFSYFQGDLKNERLLGFYVNSGTGFGTGNFTVSCISGFVSRDLAVRSGQARYPLSYSDTKNFVIAIGEQGVDIVKQNITDTFLDTGVTGYTVIGLGNGYITNYSASAAVNSIPEVNVGVLCENVVFYSGNSGLEIPAINTQNRRQISGVYFNLPTAVTNENVLLPQSITIDISSTGSDDIENVGINFQDLRIQSYRINLPLDRTPLESLGYKVPIDREIGFPLFANLDFSIVYNKSETGSLDRLIKHDINYDIAIKLFSGNGCTGTVVAARYDFRGAKFNGINYDSSIGANLSNNFSFVQEINPDDKSKGLFMSGIVN